MPDLPLLYLCTFPVYLTKRTSTSGSEQGGSQTICPQILPDCSGTTVTALHWHINSLLSDR